MSRFVKVGQASDFREGRGRAVQVEGDRVAIFKVGGRLFAIQDDCPHMGASLADGRIVNGRVLCHMHEWAFDLETGQGSPPAKSWACARIYEVKIDDAEVFVRKPDAPPPPAEEDWPVWEDDMLK